MLRRTLLLLGLLAACGQKKPGPASEPAANEPNAARTATGAPPATGGASATNAASSPSTGSGAAISSGDLGLGAAVVHVPKGLAANEKVPLVVVLHGYGASSAAIDQYSDFQDFAEEKRIAWVAPDGPKDKKGKQFWNAGSSCCNFDRSSVDHVAALGKLVARAIAAHPIDPKRVYFVGYSNGGFMAHRIACELPGVAGVVSVAGAGRKPDEACAAANGVRVLQIHGDADDIVVIGGGPLFRDEHYPKHLSAEQTVSDWAKRYGCKPKAKSAGSLDFDRKLPGAETTIRRFEGCQRGAVELWTVAGGSHFIGVKEPSLTAIWKFLSGS